MAPILLRSLSRGFILRRSFSVRESVRFDKKESNEIVEETKSASLAEADFFSKSKSDQSEKNKKTFVHALDLFNRRDSRKRGIIEFVNAALEQMDTYGVNRDIQVYKAIIDVFPKGRYLPDNLIQANFFHFAKHQDCLLDVLLKMESNRVIPDEEIGEMIRNIFGLHSNPMKKYFRMMYWMPKFKNLSPWLLPFNLPYDNLDLAKIAIEQITSVDRLTEISVYDSVDISESIDKTWIVSGISPSQKKLLAEYPKDKTLFVEGGFRVWLQNIQITYFILRGEAKKMPPESETHSLEDVRTPFSLWMYGGDSTESIRPNTVHEQEDGQILGVCATGTSSKDSLLSWIRFVQRENPAMENIPVLFTLTSPLGSVIPISDSKSPAHVKDQ